MADHPLHAEPPTPIRSFTVDRLQVRTYATRAALGRAAAQDVVAAIADCLTQRVEVNLVFAAAPSQEEFLAALAAHPAVEWPRVNAFHMDEYVGLGADAPQRFGNFLSRRLFSRVPLRAVHLIDGNAADPDAEMERYTRLLHAHPVDLVCLGIGENGHLAFNDPPDADFADPLTVKRVALHPTSRQQQVNEGAFPALEHVPTHALTLTIPALTRAARMFCMVPAASKAWAVHRTLTGPIGAECPATVLRRHGAAILYTDRDSASALPQAMHFGSA